MYKNKLFFFALILLVFASCQKINEITVEMTSEDAVESIEQLLATSSGGYAEYIKQLIAVYEEAMDSCGIVVDTTIITTTTGTTSYSYSSVFSYNLACNNLVPSIFSGTFTSSGNLNTPLLSSADKGEATSSLDLSKTEYEVDGIYSRIGTVTFKTGQKGAFTYTFSVNASDVRVNQAKMITGGSATYNFNGISKGIGSNSFSYLGTITFEGANKASLTLQGASHLLDIN